MQSHRMNIATAILGLAAAVNAVGNSWNLSCGSTCDDDLTVVASGDYSSGTQTCGNFPAEYSVCTLDVDESVTWGELYGWISEGEDCVGTEEQDSTFEAGVCTSVADYQSYIVVFEV
ncbi:hypothetical protein M406DRAFT_356776 [Cryphonectria parasitica EP155]|uniref:Uncharacterized protein n=1 Tax=Cryphonectria parasitica (strain ATCC 38755 / EP155) TaxID=660469 RepID=A0A9P5CP54_CRYP1|nr:uncharacterized protein M406DRAFT_356776 [Cryphonectria parasitica EP155]KAF3765032.1 hypothetical protein M406DRAFT_356776 [Cryphonectria parasitica EP155]